MPAAVFLDFDGVLVDSVAVKTAAMRRLFSHEKPAQRDAIVELHERLGGISRYRKFDIAFAEILRRPLSDDERNRLGQRYSELVVDAVVAAPMIAGAREFLERRGGDCLLFVVSGTPEDELQHILRRKGLAHFFASAHGSPRAKPDILRSLLAQWRLAPQDTVFVGDAATDREAAETCGIPFIGVAANASGNPFPPHIPVLADLTELREALGGWYVRPLAGSTFGVRA